VIAQLLANILVAAAQISLVAVSFTLATMSDLRLFHFAHGAVYATGAYIAFALIVGAGLQPWIAISLAILGASVLGGAIDFGLYSPLRRRRSPPLILLLVSLGVFVVIQNTIALAFGDETRVLQTSDVRAGMLILGARMTPVQLSTIIVGAAVCAITWTAVRFTSVGKSVRAIADDIQLARAVGVNTDRTILLSFVAGSGLAGAAGLLVGCDTGLTPIMGFRALLLGMTAVVVGGVGTVPGAALGSMVISIAVNVGAWMLPTHWQDGIVFAILVFFLILRPQGFLGKPLRRATV